MHAQHSGIGEHSQNGMWTAFQEQLLTQLLELLLRC